MEGLTPSRAWAQATRAWAVAAAAWGAAVEKNPTISGVSVIWGSAWRSWGSAAHAWAPGPGSDDSSLPVDHQWWSGSYHWAMAAHRWACASQSWAVSPSCDVDSTPYAEAALDWASAAVAWANPQTIWDKRLCEWAEVARLFADAGDYAAAVAARARDGAGRELPSPHNHHESVAAPVAKVPPFPANPSVAVDKSMDPAAEESVDSARENPAAREDTAPSVAGTKPSLIEKALPQDQARGDEAGTSVAGKVSVVAVDRAAAEKLDKADVPVAVDRAAAESNALDLKNRDEFPPIQPPIPSQQRPPKPRGQRDQPRGQLWR